MELGEIYALSKYGFTKYDLTVYEGRQYVVMTDAYPDDSEDYGFQAPVWPLEDYERGKLCFDGRLGDMPMARWAADWSKVVNGNDFSGCCDWQHADIIEGLYNAER